MSDPDGLQVELREHLPKMARSQSALRGRDLLDKLVYIATNPVTDGLVEKVHHWPGPNVVEALLASTPMQVHAA